MSSAFFFSFFEQQHNIHELRTVVQQMVARLSVHALHQRTRQRRNNMKLTFFPSLSIDFHIRRLIKMLSALSALKCDCSATAAHLTFDKYHSTDGKARSPSTNCNHSTKMSFLFFCHRLLGARFLFGSIGMTARRLFRICNAFTWNSMWCAFLHRL